MKAFLAGEIAKSNNTAQCLELSAERKVKNYVRLWTLEMGVGGACEGDSDCSILQAGGP